MIILRRTTDACRSPPAWRPRSASRASGYPLYEKMLKELERALREERLLDSTTAEFARIFLVDRKMPPVGHVVRQPELARNRSRWSRRRAPRASIAGRSPKGSCAACASSAASGASRISPAYRVVEREPLVTSYRGVRIVSAPPPSSGGVWLAERAQRPVGLRPRQHRLDLTRKHLIVESMRRAHRDRAEYLGDPDFVKVPVEPADRPGLRRRPARVDPRGQGDAERDAAGLHRRREAAAARRRRTSPSSTPTATASPPRSR